MDFMKLDDQEYDGQMPQFIYNMITINTYYTKPPKEETFIDFLTKLFCLEFSFISSPVIMVFIQFFIFCILCCWNHHYSHSFLGIDNDILAYFGGLDLEKINNGKFWYLLIFLIQIIKRDLLTTSFLNKDFYNLILNSTSILIFGYQLYDLYNDYIFCYIYIIGIFAGNLAFINMTHEQIVGSQFAIFSIFGALTCHWFIYYDELNEENNCGKYVMFMNITVFFILYMVGVQITFVGAEFAPFLIGILLQNVMVNKNKTKKIFSVILIIIYFASNIIFLVLYRLK